jgi:PAS domain S-box-containing protein
MVNDDPRPGSGPAPAAGPPDRRRTGTAAVGSRAVADAVLAAIIEAAPDGIVLVDPNGLIVLTNPCLERQFGYRPGELLGRPIEVLVHEPARDAHVVQRRTFEAEARSRSMGGGLPLEGRRADGSSIPVEIALSPVAVDDDVYTLAIVRDVTERVAAEGAVGRLQHLLDASSEGVFLASSSNGEVHYVNDGACALTGRPREALLHHPLDEVLPGVAAAALAPGETRQQEATVTRRDGRPSRCNLLIQRSESAGGAWLAVYVRDASARQQAEEQFWRAERALVVLEEQERLAHRLHDDVIQSLFGIATSLESVATITDDAAIATRLRRSVAGIDEAIDRMRAALFPTHHTTPVSGLRAELSAVLDEVFPAAAPARAVRVSGSVEVVAWTVGEALVAALRSALELITDRRLVGGVSVEVTVDDIVELIVVDDGEPGPDPSAARAQLDALAGTARTLGGTCTVTPQEPRGSILRWSVPVP